MTSHKHHFTLPAPAKLNLMLHITSQRADGYHNLQTLFQLLDFSDHLLFESHVKTNVQSQASINLIDDSDIAVEDNLIYQAAQLLIPFAQNNRHVDITLTKILPMGGGLGGGSSDCATALLALNKIWDIHFDLNRLADIGLTLGADVPVFVKGKSAWAEGVGEHLTPVKLPKKWFVVLIPKIHVSTAQVFTHPQLTRNTEITTIRTVLNSDDSQNETIQGHNDCEPVVRRLYKTIDDAIIALGDGAKLTGTGACVFNTFDTEDLAKACLHQLQQVQHPWQGFVSQAMNTSSTHTRLDELF
jgi:4-diphosphocytidyl-2-C-methyl-D-erythritol kinase